MEKGTQRAQIPMPGMAVRVRSGANTGCCSIVAGQEVVYLGRIGGGPRYGSFGRVRQARRRQAVVDMGRSGTWHIPYYFLGIPEAA